MWYYYLAVALFSIWWFALRPRGGGKNSPPLVTASTVVRVPVVGVIAEFLKNPNEMMKRCYKDYGQVFTIPVSVKDESSFRFITFFRYHLYINSLWFVCAYYTIDLSQTYYVFNRPRGTSFIF
jgi:hypothetical protein